MRTIKRRAPNINVCGIKREMGFNMGRLKTGTPARVDGRSIDYSKLELHPGDEVINNMPRFFSYKKNSPIRVKLLLQS